MLGLVFSASAIDEPTPKKMAEKSDLLNRFDGAIFEDNETKLSEHLLAAGLLTQYSDATRMVGVSHDN